MVLLSQYNIITLIYKLDGIHLRRAVSPLFIHTIPRDILAGIEYLITCLPCNPLFTYASPSAGRLSVVLSELRAFNKEQPADECVFVNLSAIDQADLLPEEVLAGVASILSHRVCEIDVEVLRIATSHSNSTTAYLPTNEWRKPTAERNHLSVCFETNQADFA